RDSHRLPSHSARPAFAAGFGHPVPAGLVALLAPSPTLPRDTGEGVRSYVPGFVPAPSPVPRGRVGRGQNVREGAKPHRRGEVPPSVSELVRGALVSLRSRALDEL